MSNLLNLTPEKSKNVHEAIYKNALKLQKDALLIAKQNKSFSTATSLLILSSEEIIKAFLVMLHSEGFEVYKIDGANKFFRDHKIRHELAKLLVFADGILASIDKWKEVKTKSRFEFKNEIINTFLNGLNNYVEVLKPLLNYEELKTKISGFNDNKNNGFYVDYKEKLLIPSLNIGSEKYYETLEVINIIFRVYKGTKILFHPNIVNHFEKAEIEDLKGQLKDMLKKLKVTESQISKG